jgi:hypothetical protein
MSRSIFNDKYFWVCFHLFTPKYQISCWRSKLCCEPSGKKVHHPSFWLLSSDDARFMWTSNKWRKCMRNNKAKRANKRSWRWWWCEIFFLSHFNSKLILKVRLLKLFEGSHLMSYLVALKTSCDLSFHHHCLHSLEHDFKLDLFFMGIFIAL